jgi:polysaccharide deacetylase 2 family uncharacterized protein YibQ
MFKVPFAQRDVFIDNVQTHAAVRKQIDALIRTAKEHGSAVGICHPYDVTYEVLRDVLPDLKKQVELVPASKIVHLIES